MGFGSSSPPTPQNPNTTAQNQQSYNTLAAEQNQAGSNMNQYNPYGSLTYQQTGTGPGGVPIYSSAVNLSAPEQGLLNQQWSNQGQAGAGAGGLLGSSGYASGVSPSQAIGNMQQGLEGQQMSGFLQSMAPEFQNQTSQLDTQLRNQGLTPSATSNPQDPSTWGPYEKAMYQNQQNITNTTAGAASNYANSAFNQAQTMYTDPAQLALALGQYGAAQTPNSSFTQNTGFNNAAPNYEGDVNSYNQSNMQAWAANQAKQGSMMQGLFGAAGTIGGSMLGGPVGGTLGRSAGNALGSMFIPSGALSGGM